MKTKVAPSLMNMGLLHVASDIRTLDAGADYYHVDIFDWHYVKNMCLTPHFISEMSRVTSKPIEAHLYFDNIDESLVDYCISCGAGIITMPSDVVGRSIHRLCDSIHKRGALAGVFLNPYQNVDEIKTYAAELDSLIILSVDPGFSGQDFLESTYERIRDVVDLRRSVSGSFRISVDGGCNPSNFEKLIAAGCDSLILGRGLFDNGPDVEQALASTLYSIRAAEEHLGMLPPQLE